MIDNIFYAIVMKTKTDKKIYLKEGKNNNYEWTFDRDECIWFETDTQAKEFSNNYFKNFKNWFVEKFEYNYKITYLIN